MKNVHIVFSYDGSKFVGYQIQNEGRTVQEELIKAVEKINGEYIVADSRIPRDGSYYIEDMKNIFPRSVRNNMKKCQIDGTVERLGIEIEEQAKLYFHK